MDGAVQLNTSLTSVLDRDRWSAPYPVHFSLTKEIRYPLHSGLGGLRGHSGQVWRKNILVPLGFETRTAKSVWDQYDYSIPAHENIVKSSNEDETSLV